MTAFRLAKSAYRADTMSGRVAFLAGGRWNSVGKHVVYASGNLSLATLELAVHLDDAGALHDLSFVYHAITFPATSVAVLTSESVPANWASNPVTSSSQIVGDEWIDQQASLVLAVPSVLTPSKYRFASEYMNYLINPLHPTFQELVGIGEVLEFELDPRL